MNKIILSAVALACAAQAWAYVEKTETMTVVKTDGTKVEFNVAEVEQVNFNSVSESYAMYVAPSEGEVLKLVSIPQVFRVSPAESGDPYQFGISMVEAAEPADARKGEYAIQLSVSQLKMNTANVDLAGGAESGVTVTLYRYDEGEVANIWEAQTAGTLTTEVNNKTKAVTIKLEATFEDGTEVNVDYIGAVTDTEDILGLNPPVQFLNQGEYYNADGELTNSFTIERANFTAEKYSMGMKRDWFEFILSNGKRCELYIKSEYIGQTLTFADAESNAFYFIYDDIQLSAKNNNWLNTGTVGYVSVVKNEDGSYVINVDVTNLYISSWGTKGGNPARVVMNYTGTPTVK